MPRLRVGAALLLPAPVRHEVDGLRRALGDPSLGRVPAHLTLVPPVNIKREDLERALTGLRAAASSAPPALHLSLGPPRAFLPVNPVLYLAVGGDIEGLQDVRDTVFTDPLARPLTWPFVPHVTLADGAEASRIEAAITALASYRTAVSIDRICLLQEVRGPGGRTWIVLADAFFGRPAIVGTGSPLALELVRSERIDPEAADLLEAEGLDRVQLVDRVDRVDSLDRPEVRQLVVTARRQGAVVGVAAAWLASDGEKIAVLVASPHRGQGIGTHLLASVEAAVADAGWAGPSLERIGPAGFYAARGPTSPASPTSPTSPTTRTGPTSTD